MVERPGQWPYDVVELRPAAKRAPRPNERRADGVPSQSEIAIAAELVARRGQEIRFSPDMGGWLVWRDGRYIEDRLGQVRHFARQICERIASECSDLRTARAVASSKTVINVVQLAAADPKVTLAGERFDSDPLEINTPAGCFRLDEDRSCPHSPSQLNTKITAVAPGGKAERFHQLLDFISHGRRDLKLYLQRLAGYCLTGLTTEHIIAFFYGSGANSKSTFLSALAGAMGSYAATAPIDLFLESRGTEHPTGLASLRNARLVTAIETGEGRRWDEPKIKALTGGDKIAARRMRQDYFEFVPKFKLAICGNHKPHLRSVDESMRRRLHIIPFLRQVPESERDPMLPEKLRAEWGGILAWAIDGARDWHAEGLQICEAVREATGLYLETEDAMAQWIAECCSLNTGNWESSGNLFASWRRWAERNGEFVGSGKRFAQAMQSRGFIYRRQGGTGRRGFDDIALIQAELPS